MGSSLKKVAALVLVVAAAFCGYKFFSLAKEPSVDKEKHGEVLEAKTDTKEIAEVKPEHVLQAKAGVVINADTGEILFADNAFQTLPIASLTKLMSAIVSLDKKVELEEIVSIPPDNFKIGGNLRIVPGSETVSVKDLLYASITGSANNAALSLAAQTKLSDDEFTDEMNRKAVELKLEALHYEEASGLSPQNTGSAYDIARLAGYAFSNYPLILDAASQASYTLHTKNTNREHVIKNPNNLFEKAPGEFLASKTGYLDEAMYCLVLAKKTSKGMIIAVTLGNPSEDGSEQETLKILREATMSEIGGTK